MSLVRSLIGYGLRQVIGPASEEVLGFVEQRFTDPSQALPRALARANERAWQALAIALAGDSLLDQLRVFFSAGDEKAIRAHLRAFLEHCPLPGELSALPFRRLCLDELKQLRKSDELSVVGLPASQVAQVTTSFSWCGDRQALISSAHQAVSQLADGLAPTCPNLGRLLRSSAPSSPPLLMAAFSYFFRREVECDAELARGLILDGLQQLSAQHASALAQVNEALGSLGDRFDQVFDQLNRIEGLLEEVLRRVSQAGMQHGEVKPHHSLSIRNEEERQAVRQLLARFRQLPPEQQKQAPTLLVGLGKLQLGSGDFSAARQMFDEAAHSFTAPTEQAEAHYNAFRAALEENRWDAALASIQKAAELDAQRFTPFPLHRYRPQRILGAGGFGAAFLCHDRNFDCPVVIKTLHPADMERSMAEVFQEARVLQTLSHPAIIGVRDCDYADSTRAARPYIVMDYFAGNSLGQQVRDQGPLTAEELLSVARQIAAGMQQAHRQHVLHRDLKPDNVLISKAQGQWQARIIDFGLALRRQTIETSMAVGSTGNTILGESVAGTLKYAPPEQMGELRGVKVGAYSDVYAFGKTCCFALFRTTEPRRRQLATLPADLAELLEQCIEHDLEHRLADFDAVLQRLDALTRAHPSKQPEPPPAPPPVAIPMPAPLPPPAPSVRPAVAPVVSSLKAQGGRYETRVTRANPSCLVFLVDQSSSMSKPFGRQPDQRKADGVARVLNSMLSDLVMQCVRGNQCRDYLHLAILGYGRRVGSILPGWRSSSQSLVSIAELADKPLRVESVKFKKEDYQGQIVQLERKEPIWIDPVADGNTPLTEALQQATGLVQKFVHKHPRCFPPLVVNLTDGQPTSDPRPQAHLLTSVASSDGPVLLFNIHISERPDEPIPFPERENGLPDNFAKLLFRISSLLPASFHTIALEEGIALRHGARGLVFNADREAVSRTLVPMLSNLIGNIGTAPIEFS
ncbi:MAG: protein kinase [Gemmataceae bacterium]